MVMFTGLIFLLYDTPEQCREAQPRVLDCLSFRFPLLLSIFSLKASNPSQAASVLVAIHFPLFCNSFTHLTSYSYSYLVLRHQFSHQITKAWCIKIFNKSPGTVISVTAISVSTEMQTYAQKYFKSLTSKVSLRYGSLSTIIITGKKTCMMGWRVGREGGR